MGYDVCRLHAWAHGLATCSCICVNMCVYQCVCVCMCVCVMQAKPPKKVNHLAPIAPIAKKAHSSKRSSGRAMDIDVEGRKSYM